MSSTETRSQDSSKQPRRRLSREDRQRQLLDVAWQLVRAEGTDALTLGRLAEHAGVTKPVVYDHFSTRSGLLAALYQDFDARQTALMDAALHTSDRGSAFERGYSYRWQAARKQFLANRPLCVECQREGKLTPATIVDHIKPHRGDPALFWDEKNWQPLCKKCHDRKTRLEDQLPEYRY